MVALGDAARDEGKQILDRRKGPVGYLCTPSRQRKHADDAPARHHDPRRPRVGGKAFAVRQVIIEAVRSRLRCGPQLPGVLETVFGSRFDNLADEARVQRHPDAEHAHD